MGSTYNPRDAYLPETVAAMLTDDAAPTAPLDDFVQAYRLDDNIWWRISSGHHQNLFEAACERAGLDVVGGPLVW